MPSSSRPTATPTCPDRYELLLMCQSGPTRALLELRLLAHGDRAAPDHAKQRGWSIFRRAGYRVL